MYLEAIKTRLEAEMTNGLKWLNNRSWTDITRDERFFCAELYQAASEHKDGMPYFVNVINESCGLDLPLDANWELGYEVCFYRDLWFANPDKYEMLSAKRTFDLCLFSDDMIVIIEAKVYQAFDAAQTSEFNKDKGMIEDDLKLPVKVVLVPLASSIYEKTFVKNMQAEFDCNLLTWADLAKAYPDRVSILEQADNIYGLRPKSSDKTKKFKSGSELLEMSQVKEVDSQFYWVGRGQGIKGLEADVKNSEWQDRLYEINSDAIKAPNKNWFSLAQFAAAVENN